MSGLMLALLLLAGTAHAAPPAPGSDDALAIQGHENWVTRQYAPNGQYCCNLSDGRPADARQRPDGTWEVFYAREHWSDGTDAWIAVPPSALLPTPSPFVFPFAWIVGGRVWCLALPGVS